MGTTPATDQHRVARLHEGPVRLPPRWLVTATHSRPVMTGSAREWIPYGQRHAREVGAARTRCGTAATLWPIFWDMAFASDDPAACQRCARLLESDTYE